MSRSRPRAAFVARPAVALLAGVTAIGPTSSAADGIGHTPAVPAPTARRGDR